MSSLMILLLTCDGVTDGEVCTADYGGDADVTSFYVLRDLAEAAGWHRDRARDYCPAHQPPG